jgi:hypothetical protein
MSWKYEINIKPALHEAKELLDSGVAEAETVKRLGVTIADQLAALPTPVKASFSALAAKFRRVRSRNGCDALLASLYDTADGKKVWLGL